MGSSRWYCTGSRLSVVTPSDLKCAMAAGWASAAKVPRRDGGIAGCKRLKPFTCSSYSNR